MKQVLQNLRNGDTTVTDVPSPAIKPGHILVETTLSLISPGTERMLVSFGKGSLLSKAKQQPDKVKLAINKIKTDGIKATYNSIKNKLDKPIPMGYCSVGKVIDLADDIKGFKIGDRVVSNGNHAEINLVSKNLCAKIPDNVTDEEAVYTVLSSIALHSIRLANPTIGEKFVVIGVGLLGLITIQILKANGCDVIALDYNSDRLSLAESFGAKTLGLATDQEPIKYIEKLTNGNGADGVIISASTNSNEPIALAANSCRKRGRVILSGVIGLNISRDDFFKKEISFQVSCSYGPGRYDSTYENQGIDYPIGYVRWTEQRNFVAVLDLLSSNKLNFSSIKPKEFDISEANKAYDLLSNNKEDHLSIFIRYKFSDDSSSKTNTKISSNLVSVNPTAANNIKVGIIGAGNYATGVIIPCLKKLNVRLGGIASNNGLNSKHAADKFGFEYSCSDVDKIFSDESTNLVIISTPHSSHAKLASKALLAGKNVFIEKPLAINYEQLNLIRETYFSIAEPNRPKLMLGFNRRFSPHAIKIKQLLTDIKSPKSFTMTVNAGSIPSDHWIQDDSIGGGRIIGEVCHFIDLILYFTGSSISNVSAISNSKYNDNLCINLKFSDDSIACINYFAEGHKTIAKERLEVFADGKILQLDNFIKCKGHGWKNFNKLNLWNQDKGQYNCFESFVKCIKDNSLSPIPFEQILDVTEATLKIKQLCLEN